MLLNPLSTERLSQFEFKKLGLVNYSFFGINSQIRQFIKSVRHIDNLIILGLQLHE